MDKHVVVPKKLRPKTHHKVVVWAVINSASNVIESIVCTQADAAKLLALRGKSYMIVKGRLNDSNNKFCLE